jgi:CheY-like chemotaxis protein
VRIDVAIIKTVRERPLKKVKLTHQHSLAFAAAFLCLLLFVNYFFYQSQHKNYSFQQDKFCQFLLASFTSSIEYGLNFGNKAELETTLEPLKGNPDVAFFRVVDTQGTTVAEVDNRELLGIHHDLLINTIKKDITQTFGSSQLSIIPTQILEQQEASSRRLGQIQIGLTPFNYSESHKNISYILLNLALIIPLALLWAFVRFRQVSQVKVVNKMIKVLNQPETIKDFKGSINTEEGTTLMDSIEHHAIKTQNLRHKLSVLKSEVQQARLDANTELHEFIGFITKQDFNSSVNNLMLFYEIIKQPVHKANHAVWCRDLLAKIVADLSPLARENSTLIQESFSGNRMNHQVQIDEKAFKQMLRLTLQQLLQICANHTLDIHFDLRQDFQDSAILRISFSSDSDTFQHAVKEQSLFQFREELPVTIHSNNIQLISAKHLLKKFGGEYIYLSDEIRFEIPLTTLVLSDKKSQPEQIKPLGLDLKVLVYDSDPIDKMVLIGYLNKLGVTVDKATTKQVVLQKIRHDSYDAILVNSEFLKDDHAFSFENFTSELELMENKPDIIVVSHDGSVLESDTLSHLDTAQFVSKPVEPKKLSQVLSGLIK